MINAKEVITGKIAVGTIVADVQIITHYLEDTTLYIELTNNQTISLDISKYIDQITEDKVEALKNMKVYIENGELIFEYDETILDFNFTIEDKDLIVDDEEEIANFSINENKELEVGY